MAHCLRCNKFNLTRYQTGYCKKCMKIIEKERMCTTATNRSTQTPTEIIEEYIMNKGIAELTTLSLSMNSFIAHNQHVGIPGLMKAMRHYVEDLNVLSPADLDKVDYRKLVDPYLDADDPDDNPNYRTIEEWLAEERCIKEAKPIAFTLNTYDFSITFPQKYKTLSIGDPNNPFGSLIVGCNGYNIRISESQNITRNFIRKQSGSRFDSQPLEEAQYSICLDYYTSTLHMELEEPYYYYETDNGLKFLCMRYYFNGIPMYTNICYCGNTQLDLSIEPYERGEFDVEEDKTFIYSILDNIE